MIRTGHPVVDRLAQAVMLDLIPIGSRSTGEEVYRSTDWDFVLLAPTLYPYKDEEKAVTTFLETCGFKEQTHGGYAPDSNVRHYRAPGAGDDPNVDVLIMTPQEWAFRQPILKTVSKELRQALKGNWHHFWDAIRRAVNAAKVKP